MTKERLKEYLFNVVMQEQRQYELESLLNVINAKRKELERRNIKDEIEIESVKVKAYHVMI